MTDAEHRSLADVLQRCKGNVAISGYRCDLMDELYKGWRRIGSREDVSLNKESADRGAVGELSGS